MQILYAFVVFGCAISRGIKALSTSPPPPPLFLDGNPAYLPEQGQSCQLWSDCPCLSVQCGACQIERMRWCATIGCEAAKVSTEKELTRANKLATARSFCLAGYGELLNVIGVTHTCTQKNYTRKNCTYTRTTHRLMKCKNSKGVRAVHTQEPHVRTNNSQTDEMQELQQKSYSQTSTAPTRPPRTHTCSPGRE